MSEPANDSGPVLTLGEALLALVADRQSGLSEAVVFLPHVGGAELNFAVGLARLGLDVAWLGLLGPDPVGERILTVLEREGVDTAHVHVATSGSTGLYLREWADDESRRLVYYRDTSIARELDPSLWPREFSTSPRWLHLTGVTAGLGEGACGLLQVAIGWARERGVPISFDPNFRPALWSAKEARPKLQALAAQSDWTLLSVADAELLVGTADPAVVFPAFRELGIDQAILKRGSNGCVAFRKGGVLEFAARPAKRAIDSVGAGDGFDAGFVAALLAGADLEDAVELGSLIGAHAVEAVGEHRYPRLAELPHEVQEILR